MPIGYDLARRGVRSKQRMTRAGRSFGGTPLRPGGLRQILGNRIYLGEVNHKGEVHPGEHDAIIERALSNKVQSRMNCAAKRPRTGANSVLAGRIFDANGRRLYTAHGKKDDKRYRYYVSSTRDNRNGLRFTAGDSEALVQQSLARFLSDPIEIDSELGSMGLTETAQSRAVQITPCPGDGAALCATLDLLHAKVTIDMHLLKIEIDRSVLAEALEEGRPAELLMEPVTITSAVALKRRGWAAWKKVATEQHSSNPVERSHLVRLARLRFLATDITLAIIEGRQPIELTARTLLRCGEPPMDWQEQRKVLGCV